MGDYFQPWRRKIGLATLATACVLMVVWIRSLYGADHLVLFRDVKNFRLSDFRPGHRRIDAFATSRHSLELVTFEIRGLPDELFDRLDDDSECDSTTSGVIDTEDGWKTGEESTSIAAVRTESDAAPLVDPGKDWRFRAEETTNIRTVKSESVPVVAVPFWSLVIPLTLLSAWLLISKPRTKAKPVDEATE